MRISGVIKKAGLTVVLICLAGGYALAQDSGTLFKWEQRMRNFMLDRAHNYGGTHYNRGLFREHINEMSPEHNLDLITYRYSLLEDYRWKLAQNAYRLSLGSLNATDFAIENAVKSRIPVNDKNQVIIEGYHEENIRANRFLFHLGYKRSLGKRHHVGVRHTLTREKADLDATVFYRYGSYTDGMVELDLTFMDWGSNVVQRLAEDSRNKWNKSYEVTHQYTHSPKLLSLRLSSPQQGRLKAELLGGVQIYARKRVEVHADTSRYLDEEWAHYAGALLEYQHSRFTLGLTYTRTFSKLRRKPAENSTYELDFGNRQITNQFGFYGVGRIGPFRLEQWVWYGYDLDRLQGEKVPGDLKNHSFERISFDYREEPISLKSKLQYSAVEKGITTGLEFNAEYSRPQGERAENGVVSFDFRRTYSIVRDYNARFTYTIGYRISPQFYFLAGISYDLDGDSQTGRGTEKVIGDPTWFDGGFGRFSISW